MSSLICIKSFANRLEADIAKGILEGSGIAALVSIDDAGGMRPEVAFTRGARIFVEAREADRARELLAEEGAP